jgi:hypothetical protein
VSYSMRHERPLDLMYVEKAATNCNANMNLYRAFASRAEFTFWGWIYKPTGQEELNNEV